MTGSCVSFVRLRIRISVMVQQDPERDSTGTESSAGTGSVGRCALAEWARRRASVERLGTLIDDQRDGVPSGSIARDRGFLTHHVDSIGSFHDQLHETFQVCDGTACHFGGGPGVASAFRQEGVESLSAVRCLGRCHSPVADGHAASLRFTQRKCADSHDPPRVRRNHARSASTVTHRNCRRSRFFWLGLQRDGGTVARFELAD